MCSANTTTSRCGTTIASSPSCSASRSRMRTPVRSPNSGSEVAFHEPVLLAEVLAALEPERGGVFVDCTVGLGGHTRALLEHGADRVIGFDRDQEALAIARARLAEFGDRVSLVHADYRRLVSSLEALGANG